MVREKDSRIMIVMLVQLTINVVPIVTVTKALITVNQKKMDLVNLAEGIHNVNQGNAGTHSALVVGTNVVIQIVALAPRESERVVKAAMLIKIVNLGNVERAIVNHSTSGRIILERV